jgi:hypothetical protein
VCVSAVICDSVSYFKKELPRRPCQSKFISILLAHLKVYKHLAVGQVQSLNSEIKECFSFFQIGVTITGLESLPPNIQDSCKSVSSFIVHDLPVHELINPDLIGAFQRKGI